ncbi:MAG: O-methyltransferase [Planctomycetota bacterium]|jgi:predicted O-methyltransferase YrrM
MIKRMVFIGGVMFLSLLVVDMSAQEKSDKPGKVRGGRMRFGNWMDELEKAYKDNDRDKMGKMIEDMKTRRSRGRTATSRSRDGSPRSKRSDDASAKKGDEKKLMAILKDLFENQREGMMNVPPEDGRLLRVLTESMRARHVVEIGTSNGYSGIWFCMALQKTGGKLTTYEIDAGRAKLARENFKRAGVEDIVTLIEGDAHEEVKKLKGRIDIVFLDAEKSGYIDYLNKLLPLVRPGGLILAHNTSGLASSMKDYLDAVTTSENLETIFLHKQGRGMGVTLKK